jgi:hypothetical protein
LLDGTSRRLLPPAVHLGGDSFFVLYEIDRHVEAAKAALGLARTSGALTRRKASSSRPRRRSRYFTLISSAGTGCRTRSTDRPIRQARQARLPTSDVLDAHHAETQDCSVHRSRLVAPCR